MFNIQSTLIKIVVALGLLYVIVEAEQMAMLWLRGDMNITVNTEMVVCTSVALALTFYFLRSSDDELERKIQRILDTHTQKLTPETRRKVIDEWLREQELRVDKTELRLEEKRNQRHVESFFDKCEAKDLCDAYGTFLNFKGETDLLTECACDAGLTTWRFFPPEYGDDYMWFVGLPVSEGDYATFLEYWSDFLMALGEDDGFNRSRDLEYSPLCNVQYTMIAPRARENETSTRQMPEYYGGRACKWSEVPGFESLPEKYRLVKDYPAVIKGCPVLQVGLLKDGNLDVTVKLLTGETRLIRTISLLDIALLGFNPDRTVLLDTVARNIPLEELKEELLRRQGGDAVERSLRSQLGEILRERCSTDEFEEFLSNDDMGVILRNILRGT